MNWIDWGSIPAQEAGEGRRFVMTEIKPCPCCGSESHMNTAHGGHMLYVECSVCGLCTKYYDTEEEAAAVWNKRALDPIHKKVLQDCRQAISYMSSSMAFALVTDLNAILKESK